MNRAKRIFQAALVLCVAFYVYVLCIKPYEYTIIIYPFALGSLAAAAAVIAAGCNAALTFIDRKQHPEKTRSRKVIRIIETVLVGIAFLFFAMISGWLFGGYFAKRSVKSPDGKHRAVLLTDTTWLGQPVYKYYVKRSGFVYEYVANTYTGSPEIIWGENGVTIANEYYEY